MSKPAPRCATVQIAPRVAPVTKRRARPLALAEAHRRDFLIFVWGEVHHPDGNFTVDQQFFADLNEWMDAKADDAYAPPIWRNHVDEGIAYGRVLRLTSEAAGIRAHVEFVAHIAELFDKGMLLNWSPSFYTDFQDSTGRVFKRALRELSFVGVPHMKQVPQTLGLHYALAEDGRAYQKEAAMAADIMIPDGEDSEVEVEAGDGMARVEAKLDTLIDLMTKMAGAPAPAQNAEGGEGEGDVEMSEEMKELRERVKTMEARAQKDRAARVAAEVRAVKPTISAAALSGLVALSEKDETAYTAMLGELKSAAVPPKPGAKPVNNSERGTAGITPGEQGGAPVLRALCESAKKSGIPRGADLTKHLTSKGVNFADAEVAASFSAIVTEVYASK